MIPKRPVTGLDPVDGYRFSDKVMLN